RRRQGPQEIRPALHPAERPEREPERNHSHFDGNSQPIVGNELDARMPRGTIQIEDAGACLRALLYRSHVFTITRRKPNPYRRFVPFLDSPDARRRIVTGTSVTRKPARAAPSNNSGLWN